MAMLFFDSFKHTEEGYELAKWDAQYDASAIDFDSTYGEFGWGGRMGLSYAYYLRKNTSANKTELIAGCKFKFTSQNTSFRFMAFSDSGTAQIELRAMPDGSIAAYRSSTLLAQSAPGLISIGTWYLISAKIIFSNTVGKIDVQIGATSVISTAASLDTCNTSNEYCNSVELWSNNNYIYVNDFFIFDTTGSKNNAIPNSIASKILYPTSDGTYTDFTPSTGTDHYALVDDPQLASDTDHNESSTIGHKDSYGMTTYTASGTILGVQICAAVRNTDAGTMNVRTLCRSGATPTDNEGSDFTLSSTMKTAMTVYEQEPTDTVDWTAAKINAAEFGLKVQS